MQSRMFQEAAQSAKVVRRQLQANATLMRDLGATIRKLSPRAIVTCARGSSDHAATYAKYLIEAHTQVLTASAAPSVSSVYDASMDMRGAVFLAISQSGKSPDLLAAVEKARSSGALIVAICNTPQSPLARIAHYAIDIAAGPETSVAATKSYVGSLSAIAHLLASWTEDIELMRALEAAPDQLDEAWRADWSVATDALQSATNLFVVGRGFGLGIAQEAAL
ncbi:MAG TPA: SIS domain-containing protein, partial [Steroidobacteraceae bacterium]|nr:SIS domain-containing protein [Steroidobacteraceae bacterium]